MEIEIVSRKENKILEREELLFRIKYEGKTPSRNKVGEQLGSMLGGKRVIILEYIKPVYGITEANGYARVYSSEEKAREMEAKHIIERNLKKKGAEKEKQPAEEKPVEGKKEGEKNG
ncbi:MAG: 30S ribosomal protein S24e [Candidatus Thermoplasmatota archaeon]|nr:30S ribosomal protein S24e [Candidatus Thermoplasmatota archaeon]